MSAVEREIKTRLKESFNKRKIVVLIGARRVGKTTLLRQIAKEKSMNTLWLNAKDQSVADRLERRTVDNYKRLFNGYQLVVIDEAQQIPQIGKILKLIADEIENITVVVTGSAALEMATSMGEPLTGRKITIRMYGLSEREFAAYSANYVNYMEGLQQRIIFGGYPELVNLTTNEEKVAYLRELTQDYLLKDILSFESVRNSSKILNLLRLLAFQVGGEVSYQELGKNLSISKNTVERYLDLLSKLFVIQKVEGFSRNLRKEVVKSSKWYFLDNGMLNVLLTNFNPPNLREDMGRLWENHMIAERLKWQHFKNHLVQNHFWRTYDQQEIDWVEETDGQLNGYEMKWNHKRKSKVPGAWAKAYPNAGFEVITQENFVDWLEV
ncbi:MAG: ATP-binding protein [Bacteroidetes bacterium]|nr:ATP-binding protein [Bacteroidota bacterium]